LKVLFIYPGVKLPGWNSLYTGSSSEATYISHGYASMSAVLKAAGHQVSLIDMRALKGWAHFEKAVREAEYDLAAMGFISPDLDTATVAASILLKIHPDRALAVGGLHVSALNISSFPYADYIVHGEGEQALLDILDGDCKSSVLTPDALKNLDDLPDIDRTLFDDGPERAHPLLPGLPVPNVTIHTSRGCDRRCSFCNPSGKAVFGERFRMRSVDRVIGELRKIRAERGVGSVMHHSDLIGTPKWIGEYVEAYGKAFDYLPCWAQLQADLICRHPELIEAFAKVGLLWASVGFESGSNRMLEFIHKGTTARMNVDAAEILHRNGVNIFSNVILGFPTEQPADMEMTRLMAEHIKPAWWSCNLYTNFPGSDLWQYVADNGLETEQDFNNWVYPYQKKIRGVDYAEAQRIQTEIQGYRRPITPPKRNASVWVAAEFQPTLSVVMRSWNRPKTLKRAADSVLGQTLHAMQLVIVDDASTEKAIPPLLDSIRDPRVRIIRNKKNRDGHCELINQGIDHCTGKYIGFCDDDDWRDPRWAQTMTDFLDRNPDLLWAFCQSWDVDERGNRQVARGEMPGVNDMLERNRVDLGEMVVRPEVFDRVGAFDERVHYGDDWEFVARLVKAKVPGGTVKKPLCFHSVHRGGQLNTRTERQRESTLEAIKAWRPREPFRVRVLYPPLDRLVESQRHVVRGIVHGMNELGNVYRESSTTEAVMTISKRTDLVLVVCPFQATAQELALLADEIGSISDCLFVGLHTEDPPAFGKNIRHADFFGWIVTNDPGCLPAYMEKMDRRATYMSSLSVDTHILPEPPKRQDPKWDMVIVGHMYESRRDFLRKAAPLVDWSLCLVGDGWGKEFGGRFQTYPTQSPRKTMDLISRARCTVILNRMPSDAGGSPLPFKRINRGAMEAYSGTPLLIDDTRDIAPFGGDEVFVFWHKDIDHFIEITHFILEHPKEAELAALKAQRRAIRHMTYKERMKALLRVLRGPRFGAMIP
jgi:radical SAM superfamily enzyme YgiQ (UPF0313 family)